MTFKWYIKFKDDPRSKLLLLYILCVIKKKSLTKIEKKKYEIWIKQVSGIHDNFFSPDMIKIMWPSSPSSLLKNVSISRR